MSRGIIETATRNRTFVPEIEIREFVGTPREPELPTLADLILPSTGHSISAEFACLLRLLASDGENE